jgi:hypothetical protein
MYNTAHFFDLEKDAFDENQAGQTFTDGNVSITVNKTIRLTT